MGKGFWLLVLLVLLFLLSPGIVEANPYNSYDFYEDWSNSTVGIISDTCPECENARAYFRGLSTNWTASWGRIPGSLCSIGEGYAFVSIPAEFRSSASISAGACKSQGMPLIPIRNDTLISFEVEGEVMPQDEFDGATVFLNLIIGNCYSFHGFFYIIDSDPRSPYLNGTAVVIGPGKWERNLYQDLKRGIENRGGDFEEWFNMRPRYVSGIVIRVTSLFRSNPAAAWGKLGKISIKNSRPVVSFTYSPKNPLVNEVITFDASTSYSPYGIRCYEWDFGDGSSRDLCQTPTPPPSSVTHAYSKAGDYKVTLTVSDKDMLKSSLSKTLHVEAANMNLHGKITVPENNIDRALKDVKVILELLNGQSFVDYTDREGSYTFNNIPMLDFNITVKLEDKDDIIKIYDSDISTSDVFYLKTKTITPNKQDYELDIVFHEGYGNLFPGLATTHKHHLDDNGIIYYYTHIAKVFANETLNLLLDHSLPVGIYTYSSDGTWYVPPTSEIFINSGDSRINSGNKPDNREWHEFSHHIMTDSLIGRDNLMPPSTGTNHGGYNNPDTADSWIEGFAEFLPLTIKDYLGLPNPSFYRWSGSRSPFGDDLERNYKVWGDEEFAIAGILWDLYDSESRTDNDTVDLTLPRVWNLLNRQTNLDLKSLYDTLNNSGIGDLTEDSNNNSLSDMDEIFISHGAFNDLNDNKIWEPGEEVGYTGNSSRSYRRNKPPRNDSYLLITVVKNSTGDFITRATFYVEETNEPPFDIYDREYEFTETFLPVSVPFSMPPDHATANITAKSGCYVSINSLTINSSFYWDNINTGRGYLANHTFYMVPNCPGDVNGDCQINIFDLAGVGLAYGSQPGDSNWNPNADLTGDGLINVFDLATVGLNFGRVC